MLDLFLVYQFLRRLATQFKDWEAYKLGIIDERGNILRKRRELRTVAERKAFGVYDVMILNIKKLIEKVPGGQTRLASYAAALYLIKEWNHFSTDSSLLIESVTDKQIQESLELFFSVITDYTTNKNRVNPLNEDLNNFFEQRFVEDDAPTVSVSSGAIAGIGIGPDGEPGLTIRQQRRHARRLKTSKGRKLRDILNR